MNPFRLRIIIADIKKRVVRRLSKFLFALILCAKSEPSNLSFSAKRKPLKMLKSPVFSRVFGVLGFLYFLVFFTIFLYKRLSKGCQQMILISFTRHFLLCRKITVMLFDRCIFRAFPHIKKELLFGNSFSLPYIKQHFLLLRSYFLSPYLYQKRG